MHKLLPDKNVDAGCDFCCRLRIVSNVCLFDVVEYIRAKNDSKYISSFGSAVAELFDRIVRIDLPV